MLLCVLVLHNKNTHSCCFILHIFINGAEYLTYLDGELGLNGFKSSFFSDNLLAGGSGLSFLYGFSSKKSLAAMLRRNAPPLVCFL